MQFETLRDFILLSESLSFSATAKLLYVSQSVLSKRIASLERELGATLFVRDHHSVRLTEEGKFLASRIDKLIEYYDETLRELDRMRRHVNSVLSVGYIHGAARDFLPQVCHDFSVDNPDVELELHSLEADQAVLALRRNDIDICVSTFFANCTPESFEREMLFGDECGVLVPHDHHLSHKVALLPRDLEGETVLTPSPKTFPYYSRFVASALGKSSHNINSVEEMYDISMVLPFLATGRGIAFTLRHLVSYYGTNFKFIPLFGDDLTCSVEVMWKKANEKEAVKSFAHSLKRATHDLRG